MFRRFHKQLGVVAKTQNVDISSVTKKWLEIYSQREKSRGRRDAIKFCKELNTIAERYALRQPIKPLPWTKSSNDGYPNILNPFKKNLRSKDTRLVVFTLSVFRSIELARLPISKDISTVTQPCNCEADLVSDIISFIPEWVNRIKPIKLPRLKYHFTLKNGPNGHALKESDKDIIAVSTDPHILEAIRVVEKTLGDKRPMKLVSYENKNYIHSKLSQFPDKAGKTRTIAIIDYYSQRCLKPLHEGIMNILGSLVSDGTFSHQAVGNFAKQSTKDKTFIGCSDLTAATDRFPKEIQRSLLFELIKDNDLSQALWTLLAERTFKLAWSDEKVTYNCGQPMGAYSSWPLFSLTHHLIIEYCAYKSNIRDIKHKYRVIGDDSIITDRKTFEVYMSVMTRLGLEINDGKTVKTPESSDYSGAEVAKQLYLNGKCLTPLTPGFIDDIRKPHMSNTCLGILVSRYEFISPMTLPCVIDGLYSKNRKGRKLAWLLCTNPINGNIKPGNPGYDIMSKWDPDLSGKYIENYRKIVIDSLIEQAQKFVDRTMDDLEDFMDDDIDYLDLENLDFSKIAQFAKERATKGSPWKDSTRKEPQCYSEIRFSIENHLTETINALSGVTRGESIESILARFPYVPDPDLPYMERKEMDRKRMTSNIVKLYNYKETISFPIIQW